jgi:hypothetical protein
MRGSCGGGKPPTSCISTSTLSWPAGGPVHLNHLEVSVTARASSGGASISVWEDGAFRLADAGTNMSGGVELGFNTTDLARLDRLEQGGRLGFVVRPLAHYPSRDSVHLTKFPVFTVHYHQDEMP